MTGRLSDYTPIQPTGRIRLETTPEEMTGRVIDLITPISRGQRCLITSPPKAGKTMILQTIGRAVALNHPDIYQMALLVDERPEEATDFRRNMPMEVVASTTDQTAKHHIKAAERVFAEAITRMLAGEDVLILLDSITRLARAYNSTGSSSGKTLSGGVTAGALDTPRQLFGAARNLEEAGSLTIVGTALIDTGSRMDEVIFQEFKGTGNMELILSREVAQRRLWPAVEIGDSGTRREEDMLDELEGERIPYLRRRLTDMGNIDGLSWLLKSLKGARTNAGFLRSVQPN
ncbi:MAG: transcription termination factor Rho [Bradymonadaceae bacterium]